MDNSVLKDIGIYKDKIITTLLNSSDICELLLGSGYSDEDVYGNDNGEGGLVYKQIYPYLYVDDTQTSALTYLCVEANVPRISSNTVKDIRVIVWAYSNKKQMQYHKTGYRGTKVDILADMVERQLGQSNDFGIGKLNLESTNHIYVRDDLYGREMIFHAKDFRIKES